MSSRVQVREVVDEVPVDLVEVERRLAHHGVPVGLGRGLLLVEGVEIRAELVREAEASVLAWEAHGRGEGLRAVDGVGHDSLLAVGLAWEGWHGVEARGVLLGLGRAWPEGDRRLAGHKRL